MASRALTTLPARAVALLAAALVPATACRAAHPLQTEDTGTQGAANVEIENGFASARTGAGSLTTYQPQVSVGLSPTVDAIVQPGFAWSQARGRHEVTGLIDTNLDAKWRFLGIDPWSFAVRAGIEAPTARRGLGLPPGEVSEHALLVMTWDGTPTTVHANLGLTHNPPAAGGRATTTHASAAVMQSLSERFIVTADAQLDQDPDPGRRTWPGAVLAGMIWTARPGLDLDVGYQLGIHAEPATRQWMAGVTYRFAL